MTNAVKLYSVDKDNKIVDFTDKGVKSVNDSKVYNRKYRSFISIIMIAVLGVCIFSYRAFIMKCEMKDLTEKIIYYGTIFLYLFIGFGYYSSISLIQNGKMSDIFGISNRLLSPDAIINEPIGCISTLP